MDIDNMAGSTIETMAEAVEKACLVLMCMSSRYKDSPNCRLGKIGFLFYVDPNVYM